MRTRDGVASLELTTLDRDGANPWTEVAVPGAKALSTPSLDVTGAAVWTVATAADSSTQLYRVPLTGDQPAGPPVAVTVQDSSGKAISAVTAFRLSRDGAHAALVAGQQAFVGVVDQADLVVTGARQVIGAERKDADVDVFWQDQFDLGVVVSSPGVPGVAAMTQLDKVSADGYTLDSSGEVTDSVRIEGAPPLAVQLAGGPDQQWVASLDGQLFRQPVPDPSTGTAQTQFPVWENFAAGSFPAYAG